MPNRATRRAPSAEAAVTLEPRAPAAGAAVTLKRIVATAIDIADADGLDAASIRRIATRLQMRPMSLYTYIRSKNALLELMGEEIVGEVLVGKPLPEGWRAALTAIATRSHEVFTAHPWVLAISRQRTTLGQNGLRHAEQQLEALAPLDLPPRRAWQVLFLVNDYTLGHALRVAHAPPLPPNAYPEFDPADYPHLARALSEPGPQRGSDTFLAGLDLLLDSIEHGLQRPHSPDQAAGRAGA